MTRPEWEHVPEGWARRVDGWDVPEVEAAYRRRWPEFLAAVLGTGTLGIAHEVPEGRAVVTHDPGWHNVVMTFGYVAARAAHDGTLSILDWGGGPGHYFVLARALLPDVQLDYHSRDLPRLAALGRELLPDATFHDDDRCLERHLRPRDRERLASVLARRSGGARATRLGLGALALCRAAPDGACIPVVRRAAAPHRLRLRHRISRLGREP